MRSIATLLGCMIGLAAFPSSGYTAMCWVTLVATDSLGNPDWSTAQRAPCREGETNGGLEYYNPFTGGRQLLAAAAAAWGLAATIAPQQGPTTGRTTRLKLPRLARPCPTNYGRGHNYRRTSTGVLRNQEALGPDGRCCQWAYSLRQLLANATIEFSRLAA